MCTEITFFLQFPKVILLRMVATKYMDVSLVWKHQILRSECVLLLIDRSLYWSLKWERKLFKMPQLWSSGKTESFHFSSLFLFFQLLLVTVFFSLTTAEIRELIELHTWNWDTQKATVITVQSFWSTVFAKKSKLLLDGTLFLKKNKVFIFFVQLETPMDQEKLNHRYHLCFWIYLRSTHRSHSCFWIFSRSLKSFLFFHWNQGRRPFWVPHPHDPLGINCCHHLTKKLSDSPNTNFMSQKKKLLQFIKLEFCLVPTK